MLRTLNRFKCILLGKHTEWYKYLAVLWELLIGPCSWKWDSVRYRERSRWVRNISLSSVSCRKLSDTHSSNTVLKGWSNYQWHAQVFWDKQSKTRLGFWTLWPWPEIVSNTADTKLVLSLYSCYNMPASIRNRHDAGKKCSYRSKFRIDLGILWHVYRDCHSGYFWPVHSWGLLHCSLLIQQIPSITLVIISTPHKIWL